jgi:hypothetical protein
VERAPTPEALVMERVSVKEARKKSTACSLAGILGDHSATSSGDSGTGHRTTAHTTSAHYSKGNARRSTTTNRSHTVSRLFVSSDQSQRD